MRLMGVGVVPSMLDTGGFGGCAGIWTMKGPERG